MRESIQLIKSVRREVLRWRLVLLHAFKVANDNCCLLLLLIDNALEVVKLAVHLLRDLIFKLLLIADLFLHFLCLLKVVRAFLLNIFQMLKMHVGGLLESQRLAPMCRIFEVALIAEGSVVRRRVDLQLVRVLTEFDLLLKLNRSGINERILLLGTYLSNALKLILLLVSQDVLTGRLHFVSKER